MGAKVGGEGDEDAPMNEINTTPLVDVMLVLLIIFLIAVPVAIQTAPITLPKENSIPTSTKPENIVVSIDADGNVYWNASLLEDGVPEMRQRIVDQVVATVEAGLELPEVHIRADAATQFQYVGRVIYAVQTTGIPKVAFISEQLPRATQ